MKATLIGPGEARMHSMTTACLTPIGEQEKVRRLSAVDCILRYDPMQSPSHQGLTMGGTKRKI